MQGPGARLRGRRLPSADPLLAALGAGAVALVPLFLTGMAGSLTSWSVQTGLDLLIVALCLRLARLTAAQRHARRFWRAIAVTGVCCLAGDTYQTIQVAAHGRTDPSLVQTAFVLTGMVIAVVTMLRHPLGGAGRQRLRLWLDSATVLTAVAVFLWHFTIAGAFSSGNTGVLLGAAAISAVMLLITFGLLKLTLSGTAPFRRGPGLLACLGVAGTAVATSAVTQVTGSTDPGVVTLAALLPCFLMPVSLRVQELQLRRGRTGEDGAGRRGASRLPYFAVATVQLLLVWVLLDEDHDMSVWGVAVGAALITGIVLARQVAAFTDNERLLAEVDSSVAQISSQREWFRVLVQHSFDVTVVVNADGTVRYATPASERVLGVAAETLTGTRLSDYILAADRPVLRELTGRIVATPGAEADAQLRMQHADGSYRWLQVVGVDLTANAAVGGFVFNARDITESRALHDELRHRATHDALTGLANRALLEERLAALPPAGTMSVLLIDLDGFKPVNDRYGHHAGDQVLTEVAARLHALAGVTGLAARLGGDEFAMLLPGTDETGAGSLADRIAVALAEPITLAGDGTAVSVGASIGGATGLPGAGYRLLREADAAMYAEKTARRSITL